MPPKGLPGVGQHELFRLHQTLALTPVGESRHFQSGVTYRTLCRNCNTVLLGGRYDPALIEFANSVVHGLRAATYGTHELDVTFLPNLVMRAAAGHLLAIGVEAPAAGPAETAIRDFFMDESKVLPPELEFHAWVYPSNRRVLIRGGIRDELGVTPNMLHYFLLKFFPLALMFTFDSSLPLPGRLPSLAGARSLGLRDAIDALLPLRDVPPIWWPELPGDDNHAVCVHGDRSAVSLPRRQR